MNTTHHEQFVQDLLTESHDGLDRYDAAILGLEKGESDPETLNDVFRVIHTLKGTAGCLGFRKIERVAHAGEQVLDGLREGHLEASAPATRLLLRLSDALRSLLRSIEETGRDEASTDFGPLASELRALAETGATGAEPAPPAAAPAAPAAAEPVGWGLFEDPAPAAAAALPAAAVGESAPRPPAPPAASPAPAATSASVRVDVALLDKLMNLVGELVLSRNQLTQMAQSRRLRPESVTEVSQRLNLVTTELQEGVMKTRMQPIGNVWAKFPRIVHDIAHELGKQVRLETVGAETELDRTIIESIRDPLTHIVRNSIDHGIEEPARRAVSGKPAEGHILMRAYHEGGQVNIEIIDDGAGINLERVRQKAVAKGHLSADEAGRLSEREITNLIFLPGFSTAEKVTNVSGRGVGMDVVKTNIEKIGGSVDVQTTLGQGTMLKIKIPLTLAIVPALIVRAGGARFAIPQVSLLELVRLEGKAAAEAIEHVYGAPVFRLRGRLLPVVFLHRELQLAAPAAGAEPTYNIVVLQADQRQFGLVVDQICDSEEIVVKPLGPHLKGLPMFAGATIMGDGRVALILDALGLAHHARVVSETQERNRAATRTASAAADEGGQTQYLLFSLKGRHHLAIPLDQAARLEVFPAARIERSSAREAVQYRGGIMPLVRLEHYLPGLKADPVADGETLQVIVSQRAGQAVGIVVERIRDIIATRIDLQADSAAPGILGSAVVQGRITDVVDVSGILLSAGFPPARAA